jgi:hypothetical protein
MGGLGPGHSHVANAMADSEHVLMSKTIVGTATGQAAVASNAGT